MQASGAHHRDGGLDRGLGDRLLLGEAACEDGFSWDTFGRGSTRSRSCGSVTGQEVRDHAIEVVVMIQHRLGPKSATARPVGPKVTSTQGTPPPRRSFGP
jgi:hypothetical protein